MIHDDSCSLAPQSIPVPRCFRMHPAQGLVAAAADAADCRLQALDDEGRCGPYLAASSADCGQEAVQTQAFQQGSEAQQWLLIPAA